GRFAGLPDAGDTRRPYPPHARLARRMTMIMREFRGAWRRLLKRPGYAVLSIAILGVGLGVVLFLFSLVNTMILQPLPFPQAQRLMAVGETSSNGYGIWAID